MRGMHFCLVDEADSILIDEARTPLIIGASKTRSATRSSKPIAGPPNTPPSSRRRTLHDRRRDETIRTDRPRPRAWCVAAQIDLVRTMGLVDLYEYTERAVKVHHEFILDRQYVVRPGQKGDEIVIVDEFTGRLAEGRKWRDGIHQAIEAKEKIEISVPTGQAARITVQDLFLRYPHLAGMTGTAATSAGELKKIYRTPVIRVPTNRPPKRVRLADRVFGSMHDKFSDIVEEVKEMHAKAGPVLIGTRSIDKSEVDFQTARRSGHRTRSAQCEQRRRRSRDRRPGWRLGQSHRRDEHGRSGNRRQTAPGVEAIGGMHVICTELHDAARIDRQLIGRCGRQGDNGSYRQYLSLDDDILKNGFGPDKGPKLKKLGDHRSRPFSQFRAVFRKAQSKVERKHFRDRMVLLHHEKERKKMQREIGQDPYLDTPD